MTSVTALSLALSSVGCAAEDDATDAEAPQSVELSVAFVDALSGAPLAGVELCAAERDDVPCDESDAEGRARLELPANQEYMLRCASATHGPAYMTWAIGGDDIEAGTFSLLGSDTQKALQTIAGAKDLTNKGAITVNVYTDLVLRNERVTGATASLEPNTGLGPVYLAESKFPDPTLTSTTLGGPALFVDLEPGDVSVSLAHPSLLCETGFGWPSEKPLTLRSRIYAGGLSNVTFVCPKP